MPDLKFHKTFTMGEIHASMPNPVESIGYINSYSSSIPRPTKDICNFETVKAGKDSPKLGFLKRFPETDLFYQKQKATSRSY